MPLSLANSDKFKLFAQESLKQRLTTLIGELNLDYGIIHNRIVNNTKINDCIDDILKLSPVIPNNTPQTASTTTDDKIDTKEQPTAISSITTAIHVYHPGITSLLSDPVLIHKYAAQFKRIAGLVAYNTTVEYLKKDLKVPDGKLINLVSTAKATTDFEGWNQIDFLTIHVRFLIELYIYFSKKLISSAALPINNEQFLEQDLLNEIWVTTNALSIYSTYSFLLKSGNDITPFIESFLNSLAEIMLTLKDKDELIFPLGTGQHAMYLALVRYRGTVLLRLDNLGQGIDKINGLRNGGKVKPYIIAQIKIAEITSNQALRSYLHEICLASNKPAAEALPVIYNLQSRLDLPVPMFKDAGYPGLPEETMGRCVVGNFEVGMRYRLYLLENIENPYAIFDWLVGGAISVGFGDQKSSDDNIFSYFQGYRRAGLKKTSSLVHYSLPLPPDNAHYFIGRINELEILNAQFEAQQAQYMMLSVVTGLGGVGKTQLATYYIHHPKQRYKQRLWFHVETQTALSSDCLAFARQQGLIKTEDKLPEREIILVVKDHLEKTSDWLAVYDNAGKYQDLKDFIPQKGGHIIITTRHQEWSEISKKIDVGVFSKPDAIKYLKNVIQREDWNEEENTALEILAVTELGCLPLALAQAGAYIQKSKISIVSYLELYHKRKLELLADQTLPPDSKDSQDSNRNSVATTWAISLEAIQNDEKELKQKPVSISVLHAMAYLYSDNIPRLLLEKWLQKAGLAHDDSSATLLLNQAVMHLTEYSMIQANQKQASVSAHRLVQEVIRLKTRDDRYFSIEHLFLAINDLFEILKKKKAYAELWVLKANLLLLIEYMDKDITKYEKTLNEALLLSNNIHLESFKGIDSDTLYQSIWSDHNTLIMSLPVIKRIYTFKFYSNILADNMKKIAESVHSWKDQTRLNLNLAAMFLTFEQREILEKSMEYVVNNWEKDEKFCQNNKKTLLMAKAHLPKGWIRKYDEGITLQESILPELVAIYGESNQLVAIVRSSLGVDYRENNSLRKSAVELSKALVIFEKNIPGHPLVALTQMELAVTYQLCGEHNESKKLYEQALPILRTSILKEFLQHKSSLVRVFDDCKKGLEIYRKWRKDAILEVHDDKDPQNLHSAQQSIAAIQNDALIQKSLNALAERVWVNFVKIYKAAGVFNFSWITGWRYPGMPRLRGEFFKGGFLLGRCLSIKTPEGLFNDIIIAADLACNQLPFRGICYFWISPTQAMLLLTNPNDIAQILKVHHTNVSHKIPIQFYGNNLQDEANELKRDSYQKLSDEKTSSAMLEVIKEKFKEFNAQQPIDLSDFFTQLTLNIFAKHNVDIQKISTIGHHEKITVIFQFVIKLLAKSPHILKNLRQELLNFKQPLSYTDIDKLEYLRAIIKETLRVYPPLGFILRSVDHSFTLINSAVHTRISYTNQLNDTTRNSSGDIKIHRGDVLLISPYITHHRADLWPDPEKFIPERHLSISGNIAKKITISPQDNENYSYIPFGVGDHGCVCWNFVERELMLTLATLYSQYDVAIKGENNFDLVCQGIFKLKNPTLARFSPATNHVNEIDIKRDNELSPLIQNERRLPSSQVHSSVFFRSFLLIIGGACFYQGSNNYLLKIFSISLVALGFYELFFSKKLLEGNQQHRILVIDVLQPGRVIRPSLAPSSSILMSSMASIFSNRASTSQTQTTMPPTERKHTDLHT